MTQNRRWRRLANRRVGWALTGTISAAWFAFGLWLVTATTSPDRLANALSAATFGTVTLLIPLTFSNPGSSRAVMTMTMPPAAATPDAGTPTGARDAYAHARILPDLPSHNVTSPNGASASAGAR